MRINTRGLQELQVKFRKLEGSQQVSLAELLTDPFISNNSQFSSLQEMVDVFGGIETPQDFEGAEWSAFVSENSDFDSWEEMRESAIQKWLKQQLR